MIGIQKYKNKANGLRSNGVKGERTQGERKLGRTRIRANEQALQFDSSPIQTVPHRVFKEFEMFSKESMSVCSEIYTITTSFPLDMDKNIQISN